MTRQFLKLVLAIVLVLMTFSTLPAAQSDVDAPGIVVVGRGTVETFPDLVQVVFSVSLVDESTVKAKSVADDATSGILKACDDLGIPRDKVTASKLTVGPANRWAEKRPTPEVYEASRWVTVNLTNPDLFNDLVQRALQAGANNVESVVLKTAKEAELKLEAIARAFQDAARQGEAIAKSAGRKLGDVRSIATREALDRERFSPYAYPRSLEAAPAPRAEFRPGPIGISAEVVVRFAIR